MEMNEFLALLNKKKQTIFTIVLISFIVAGFLTINQPFLYQSESKILVYQDNTDPYAMSKSGQYLSSLLTNVIPTNSFYEEVMKAGYNIDVFYFSTNEAERLAIWKNTVSPSVVDDSGVFKVDVYHTDPYQVEQIALAIDYVLKTKHSDYHGAGDKVTVKIVDSPITSSQPVRPRIWINLFAGVVCGLILSFMYIYLFPEDRFNIKLVPGKKIKVMTNNFDLKRKIKEKQDIKNVEQLKRDLQEALNIQLALNKKELVASEKMEKINTDKEAERKPNIRIESVGTIDIEDIEREGSMSNIIGFSNLGN